MAVLLLTGGPGAPGVTTTALGMSLLWPRDVVLLDADRDPSQAVLAGFLQGADARGRGMVELARAHREGRPLERELLHHCLPLGQDSARQRLFLPGFTRPGTALLFDRVWSDLGRALQHLDGAGFDVVVDAGRLGAAGLPRDLLAVADAIAVVTRTTLRSLAATRLYLPDLGERVALARGRLGLLLVGDGEPYSGPEISAELGVAVWSTVERDPAAAAVFSDGAAHPRRFAQSGYVRSLRQSADLLAETVAQGRRQVQGPAGPVPGSAPEPAGWFPDEPATSGHPHEGREPPTTPTEQTGPNGSSPPLGWGQPGWRGQPSGDRQQQGVRS